MPGDELTLELVPRLLRHTPGTPAEGPAGLGLGGSSPAAAGGGACAAPAPLGVLRLTVAGKRMLPGEGGTRAEGERREGKARGGRDKRG